MSKEIVLDIETQNSFADVGGAFHDKLKISIVCLYDYATNEYSSYLERELPQLWPRLERADRIIGYNTKGFDNLVMNSYYTGDFNSFPNLDLLEEIAKTLGFRVKLDDVAHATLGIGKSGHGLQAIEFYRKGEMEKLKKYCLDDVRITKEVYEYGLQHGFVSFFDRMGGKRDVAVDFSRKALAPQPINLTLGF
jgi:DEAD/DEAH box helicase domain-containing protein